LFGLGLLAALTNRRLALGGIHLEAGWPLSVAGALVSLNLGYLAMARAASRGQHPAIPARYGLWLQIFLDLALLTVVIHYLGSLATGAPFMYLFHVVLACIFLSYGQSLVVTLSALGMYAGCLALETAGAVPPQSVLAGALVFDRAAMPLTIAVWHCGFLAFICGTVWYLASHLANALHQREKELAATNRRLVAATVERAKHMLRTTHQLKAPFAAIHANAQVLSGGFCGEIPAAAAGVIRQISARCEMLSREIKAMLQLANLRSSAQDPPLRYVVDLAAVIRSSAAGFQPAAARRQIAVEEDLQSAPVCVVPDHAVMIIDNILSNAINYSHNGGKVAISCRATSPGGAAVVVRDAGIGTSTDKLPRIFDDYFRTNQAAKHNQASTGLGLAIVRQAAIAGRIAVRVESAEGQGTQFFLDFPGSGAGPEILTATQ